MRTYFRLALFSLCLVHVTAALAHAGEDPATVEARLHYQKAQKAYDLGHWDEAIAEYEAAYSLRSDPTFLYNMAQAHRRKGDANRALDLFRNYLVKVPNSPQRPDIEERILTLKKQIEDEKHSTSGTQETATVSPAGPTPNAPTPGAGGQTSPAEPVALPPAAVTAANSNPVAPVVDPSMALREPFAATRENPSLRVAGLIVGGAGVAAIVGGVVMGLRASTLSDQVSNDAKKQPVGTFDQSKYDSGKTAQTLQWVGYGVGAAALVGGAILYWLGMPKSENPATQTLVTLLPYASADGMGGHLLVGF